MTAGAASLGRRTMSSGRKAGVASDDEFASWMARNKVEDVVVVDARNTDFSVERGDEKYGPSGRTTLQGVKAWSVPVL